MSDTLPGWIEATGLPPGVRGGTATRRFAGVSAAPFGPANYSDRGGDDPAAVARIAHGCASSSSCPQNRSGCSRCMAPRW